MKWSDKEWLDKEVDPNGGLSFLFIFMLFTVFAVFSVAFSPIGGVLMVAMILLVAPGIEGPYKD
jgi:hypothetical protein